MDELRRLAEHYNFMAIWEAELEVMGAPVEISQLPIIAAEYQEAAGTPIESDPFYPSCPY